MNTNSNTNTNVGATIGAFNSIRHIRFPHTLELLSVFVTISIAISLVSFSPVMVGMEILILLGFFGLAVPALVLAMINSQFILHSDTVFDFRRLMGIELASLVILGLTLIVSVTVGILLQLSLWIPGFFVGITASLPLRYLSILSMSEHGLLRKFLAATLPPVAITRTFFGLITRIVNIGNIGSISLAGTVTVALGIIVAFLGCYWIIRTVEKTGGQLLEYSPLTLFRAFLDHWLGSNSVGLEENLKKLGVNREIETRILAFRHPKDMSSIIVSTYHPGPYRDLGSAGLPSQMQTFVHSNIGGTVHVPHSISNHELNIISKEGIATLLAAVKENFPSIGSEILSASEMIRGSFGSATVTAQAFGKIVILMITLAPEAMEDLPEEVSKGIIQESNKFGFTPIIIDAHNSILEQTVVTPSQVQDILKASSRVLRNLSEMRQSPVACGSANDPLKQFSLVDGIGLGGLAVTLVKTDSQLAGYVTIDGNNMHQGFRQIILESLKQLGISEAEVMTTDTHLVTGLVAASRLGYYPIGAHLSHSLFLEKLGNTVKKALANIAPATLGFSDFTVTLEVLGQNAFDSITRFIGRIASRIAHYFYWLELSLILLSSLVLYVFL